MIWRWLWRLAAGVVILAITAVAVIITRTNPEPWSAAEITQLTIGLNEAAAVGVPHGFLLQQELRQSHSSLLAKVEAGAILTGEESLAYRKIFQTILFDSQAFLARFDAELSVLPNHAMHSPNNIASAGIAGHHDHHDLSARRNFAGLLQSLENLDRATSSFARIRFANAAQKDLVDLISHLGVAPHTVSVPYVPPEQVWPDAALGEIFENMVRSFKAAQFADVHSPAYWATIDQALAQYNALILAVQTRVVARTSLWERRVAGRFMSVQTLSPPVDLNRPLRRK